MKIAPPPLVLAYHTIATVSPAHDPNRLAVTPARFRDQVLSLLERGYELVKLSTFVERLRAGGPPKGVCALTFDDGSADNAEVLPPLLERLGVAATLFVCPGLLGRPHPWLAADAGVRLMTREELQVVARLPFIEIGSHTREHADLGDATEQVAHQEMVASKVALEDLLGTPILSFAYPFCRYSPACPSAAERAGYVCAATCEGKGGWQPYELRREGVASWDNRLTFALKSRGALHHFLRTPAGRFALAWRRRGQA